MSLSVCPFRWLVRLVVQPTKTCQSYNRSPSCCHANAWTICQKSFSLSSFHFESGCIYINAGVFSLNAVLAVTCFCKAFLLLNSKQSKHINKPRINSDTSLICFFLFFTSHSPLLSFSSQLFSLFLGGGEDYRQNPAESHKSPEGELQFYGHMGALMSWLLCSCFFHYSFLSPRHCFFALWTQDVPLYIMQSDVVRRNHKACLIPTHAHTHTHTICSAELWQGAAKNTPAGLFVTYPCLAVITNYNEGFWDVSWLLSPNPALSTD